MEDFSEKTCAFESKGKTFICNGTWLLGGKGAVYIAEQQGKLIATTWHGDLISDKVKIKREWQGRGWLRGEYNMRSIDVTMDDGAVYFGQYGNDTSNYCNIKRKKVKK